MKYSAPGKLILFGEYAVLAGGLALVSATSQRVSATRFSTPSTYKAHGLQESDLPESGPGKQQNSTRLVESILDECGVPGLSPHYFETDVRALMHHGIKLGLGSSAATTVALTAAILGAPDGNPDSLDQWRDRIFRHAFSAHRQFQHGRGSGLDIAASTYGNTLAYRLKSSDVQFPFYLDIPDIQNIPTPPKHTRTSRIIDSGVQHPNDLIVRAIWLGKPASSVDFIKSIERVIDFDSHHIEDVLNEISTITYRAYKACIKDDPGEFLRCVTHADIMMETLGQVTQTPIITQAHQDLRILAHQYGIATKPSGAGGGDFSLLVGPTDARWRDFEESLSANHYIIDVPASIGGVNND